jgi:hypothetical protein
MSRPPAFHKPLPLTPPTLFHSRSPLQDLRPVHNSYSPAYQPPSNVYIPKPFNHNNPQSFPPPLQPTQKVPHSAIEELSEQHKYPWSRNFRYKSQDRENSGKPRNRHTSRIKSFVTTYIIEWWLIEILSLSFSSLCMGAILAVLYHYDNKAMPNWKVIGITLNALITLLSGLAKAALLLPTAECLGQLKW